MLGCCSIVYSIAIFRMDWSAPTQRSYALSTSFGVTLTLLVLRLPQICAGLLLMWAVVGIVIAVKKARWGNWKVYVPLAIFVIYCLFMTMAIPAWAESSMRAKLAEEGGERWCEGMVGRVHGGWPSPPDCALSDQVAVVIWYWSFVTLDGRMPVLVWSESGTPNPQLPTRPTSCKQLDTQWFFCYLDKPSQLTYDYSGLCSFDQE